MQHTHANQEEEMGSQMYFVAPSVPLPALLAQATL
jgi:hypothetical protein